MVRRFALLMSFLCCSLADAAPVGVESGIDAVFAEHVRAVQARDLAALERTITSGEQLTLILPNGEISGTRQAYIDFHRKFFATKTWTIQFEPIDRAVGSDFAVLTTKSLYQDKADGSRSRSWVTFTFHKEAGQWRLIHDQNTRLPPSRQ
ncbi:MAG TPA: nuclear transport factor 2 family protein [Steroidobacteraceae bacterium]|nr:nuclear transport factor 2 family protein [Steroidobacteraceae bacterium]